MKLTSLFNVACAACAALLLSACIELPEIWPSEQSLTEQSLSGAEYPNKVLLINIDGTISESGNSGFLFSSASMLEEFTMQIEQAAQDPMIRGILLKINSPGGTVTASDIIYQELRKYKKKTGNPVVVCMMSVAASGGYYIALAADEIMAHPTTITGSVGVIMMSPNFSKIMGTLGIQMNVYKSGENKDAGAMYRRPNKSDADILNTLVMEDAERFWGLVRENRPSMSDSSFELVKTARIFSAQQALKIGLIDKIGYVDDAVAALLARTGLKQAHLVTYRRHSFPNDNVYNTRMQIQGTGEMKAVDLGAMEKAFNTHCGCYYLWTPGLE